MSKSKLSVTGYKDWSGDWAIFNHSIHITPAVVIYHTGYMFEIAISWIIWTVEFRWEVKE